MTAWDRAATLPLAGAGLVLPPGAFRLLLASSVLVSHISALNVGRLAVLLFFFLSGYWTSRIYAQKFGNPLAWRFYVGRYWRILPLFLLATAVAFALRPGDIGVSNLVLLGVASFGYDPTIVSWSLDIELQFYLLLPVLALAVGRWPLATLAASLPLLVVGAWLDYAFEAPTVLEYLPIFVAGVLTHRLDWRPSERVAMMSLAAFAAMTIAAFATGMLIKTPETDGFWQGQWSALWMLPLLPYVARSLMIRSTDLDRHLGNVSFPLYLAHYPIVLMVSDHLGRGPIAKVLIIVASAAVAFAIYRLIDRPIDHWRTKVTG